MPKGLVTWRAWNYRPKGHAALSRSTSVKPPALPEVADYQVIRVGFNRGRFFGMTLTWRRSGEIRITRLWRSGYVLNHQRVSVFASFGCNAAGNSEQQEKDGSVFHGCGIRLQTWRTMSSPEGSSGLEARANSPPCLNR